MYTIESTELGGEKELYNSCYLKSFSQKMSEFLEND